MLEPNNLINSILEQVLEDDPSRYIIQTELILWWYSDNDYHLVCEKFEIRENMNHVIVATNQQKNPTYMIRLSAGFLKEVFELMDDEIRIEFKDDYAFWMLWKDQYTEITKMLITIRLETGELKIKTAENN